jgi:hypothetical protein
MLKNMDKKFYMYISIVYVCSSRFHEKLIFCVVYIKKEKVYLVKSLIFSTEFCLFYTRHMISPFFMKRLYEHVAREDVRANF